MMDGYSVTEAASVLGVPTERVWELLARGVLSGRPEGESGMRVFLQPRPHPAAPAPAPDEGAGRANGSDRAELSPFRELLTEFRNLTERYGQALLALGEARGEVASLRSRVDVLEARMELRLPFAPQAAPAAWPMPSAPVESPPAPPIADEDDADAHRSRRRGARRATESFAEALARAEDPSVPDLPPATASASPADGTAVAAEPAAVPEPSLPREVAPAEPMPVADEPEPVAGDEGPTESAAIAEPEADGEPEDSAAAAVEVAPPPVDVPADTEPVARRPAEVVEPPAPEARPEPGAQAAADEDAGWPDESSAAHEEPELESPAAADAPAPEPASVEPDVEPESVEAAPQEASAEPAAPIDFDEDRYSTAIELPDWFAAEVEPAEGPEDFDALPHARPVHGDPDPVTAEPDAAPPASQKADDDTDASAPDEPPADVAEPNTPEPAREASAPAVSAPAEAEDAILREPGDTSGAEEMEIAPAAATVPDDDQHAVPTDEPELPGSSELNEALAALDELRRRTSTAPVKNEWPGPSAGSTASVTRASDAARPRPVMTAGPATRAYRRLRRIFPE